MSLQCRCGNETNETDGVCRVCKLFGENAERMALCAEQKTGGEKMGKSYKKKCEVEECKKQAWKDGCCMVHYKEKHGIPRRKSGPKSPRSARILPPPVIKVRAEVEKTTSVKSSDDIDKIIAQIVAKRDMLKFEIVKLDGALLTLSELTGIQVPAPEFLRAE